MAYTVIEKHQIVRDILGKRTAAAMITLSPEKKRYIENIFRYVARLCCTHLQGFMDSDRGKSFFPKCCNTASPSQDDVEFGESNHKCVERVDKAVQDPACRATSSSDSFEREHPM